MAASPASDNQTRMAICSGRYELRLSEQLPELTQPGADAYGAAGLRGGGSYFALAPHPNQLPRTEHYGQALNITSSSVIRYLDQDIFFNPATGRRQPVLVFERPEGVKLLAQVTDERPPVNGDLAFRQMVESLHDGLRDMHLAGVCHGGINPGNLFQRETGAQLQLGPYLAVSPGVAQWPVCETIEREMADETGRGPPTPADDIYAAGVTLLIMMMGRLPTANLTSVDLLHAKIEKGSMMALLGGTKLPSAFSEIFRSLLADDATQRWGLDDVQHWLGGRRMGNKSSTPVKKSQRALEFDGHPYYNLRAISLAMSEAPDKAAQLIEEGALDRWLRRSLLDEEVANSVAETIGASAAFTKGATPAERMVARVCITLDPAAPLRIRGIAVLPYGFATRLASQFLNSEASRGIPDALLAQLMTHWSHRQPDGGLSYTTIMQNYEGARMLLERPSPGFGIERILYELNPGLPCLSLMIEKDYPTSPAAVLAAMEKAAGEMAPDEKREPMDRHIAAYLLSHLRKINDRFFTLLAPGTPAGQRATAILSILAETQRRSGIESVPSLAQWLSRMLVPSVERFHNRPLREKILKDLRRIAKKGRLDQMLELIDDAGMITRDEEGYSNGRQEYAYWEQMARAISADPVAREQVLMHQGRLITSFIAIFSAMITGVVLIFWLVT